MRLNHWAMPFEKTVMSAAVCVGLLALTPAVQAVMLTATAAATLPNEPLPNLIIDFDASLTSAYAHVDNFGPSGDAYSTARGNDAGWMYANAGGDGVFSAESTIQQSYDITNNAGSEQNYFFDFTINFGSVNVEAYTPLSQGQIVSAGNRVSIKLNGDEIFNSDAELTLTDAGYDLDTDGVVLGVYDAVNDPWFYSWGLQSSTLDLGAFGDGESFNLTYDITTFANSNVPYSVDTCGVDQGEYGFIDEEYGFFDGEIFLEERSCSNVNNYAYSQFGDPNGFNALPITNTISSQATAVPEPGALFLLGGGLAGLAYTRRRKQRKA